MRQTLFEVIDRLVEDRELGFRFFAVFSRFEYALKRSNFIKKGQFDAAMPDWDRFATQLRGHFAGVKDEHFIIACKYLEEEPPKKQIVQQGRLAWHDNAPRDDDFEEKYLLRLVRTVRNNLFHGGKYPYPIGSLPEAIRNRVLLENSMVILEQCLALSLELRSHYEEAV